MNNLDLYKLGVNRAGGLLFQGMIDNVMIWDTALENSSVTALNRNTINNCSAYSGNGQDVAYLETTYDIPTTSPIMHGWFMLMVQGLEMCLVSTSYRLHRLIQTNRIDVQ